jgi:hypothetical protein
MERDAGPTVETVRCTQCAEEISAAALVCKHCGRKPGDYRANGGRITPDWVWGLVTLIVGGLVLLYFLAQIGR